MPELCRFGGIVIQMYFKDIEKHHKPHIHVIYNKTHKVIVGIDGKLLAGRKLPPAIMKKLKAWITLREDELKSAWDKAVNEKLPNKIKP